MPAHRSEGAQVVEKTCRIVREISKAGPAGARLTDLTRHTGFSRPSVHRVLSALKEEKFVTQTDARRYTLTSLVHEIGLSAPHPAGDTEALRPLVQALSDQCGDTVYLSMRTGAHAYYLMRGEGRFPIRTYIVEPHRTLHLVSCHSGRALLAAMPEGEAQEIIDSAWSHDRSLFNAATRESLLEEIQYVRDNGFGWARDVTFQGVAGMTQSVPNENGTDYLAVTISAVSQRLDFDRVQELRPLLKQTISRIKDAIEQGQGGRPLTPQPKSQREHP